MQWLKDIDRYIVNVYNQKDNTLQDIKEIRFKVDTLCRANGVLLATMVLKRLQSFCKV